MNAGGDPITKCPMCRYDLSGLPKNHRCPECGFEYDETMRIWYFKKGSRLVFVPIVVLISISFLSSATLYFLKYKTSANFPIIETGSLFFQLIFLAMYIHLSIISNSFILINSLGFWNKLPILKPKFYRWDEIWVPSSEKRIQSPWNRKSKNSYRAVWKEPRGWWDYKATIGLSMTFERKESRMNILTHMHKLWSAANQNESSNIDESAEPT